MNDADKADLLDEIVMAVKRARFDRPYMSTDDCSVRDHKAFDRIESILDLAGLLDD